MAKKVVPAWTCSLSRATHRPIGCPSRLGLSTMKGWRHADRSAHPLDRVRRHRQPDRAGRAAARAGLGRGGADRSRRVRRVGRGGGRRGRGRRVGVPRHGAVLLPPGSERAPAGLRCRSGPPRVWPPRCSGCGAVGRHGCCRSSPSWPSSVSGSPRRRCWSRSARARRWAGRTSPTPWSPPATSATVRRPSTATWPTAGRRTCRGTRSRSAAASIWCTPRAGRRWSPIRGVAAGSGCCRRPC